MLFRCFLLSIVISTVRCQIGAISGGSIQRINGSAGCQIWTPYDECSWPKDAEPNNANRRWNQPFFNQMSKPCQEHPFYADWKLRAGDAVESIWRYFRNITEDTKPAGMCSFKRSCGFRCAKPVGNNVSEVPCENASHATTVIASFRFQDRGCKVWPNPLIDANALSVQAKNLLNQIDVVNCIPGTNSAGQPTCRCCCQPYKPDPKTFECKKP